MAELLWDQIGERFYETGVDHGVLYIPDNTGAYTEGVAWNGLVSVSETPSGAESNKQYADNIVYLNLFSAEEFGATLEAFTFPEEFNQFDGMATPQPGLAIGQQPRKAFGLAYRTKIGNDLQGNGYGFKLHLIYGATASPSERTYTTINDSPEPMTLSWELTTVPVAVPGYEPTALITIDSTKVNQASLTTLMQTLYGTNVLDPRLPSPAEVLEMFAGTVTLVTPSNPSFVAGTGVITIPSVTGVQYRRGDNNTVVPPGTVTIPTPGASLVIRARPSTGAYAFTPGADDDWNFTRTP